MRRTAIKGVSRKEAGGKEITILRAEAARVMKTLGVGHSERVYHRAMITALNKRKVAHRSEVLSPIYFMGETVGVGRCDLVINRVAVELKANTRHPRRSLPQLRKYIWSLSKTEKKTFSGIIINFNQKTRMVQMCHVPPTDEKHPKGRAR